MDNQSADFKPGFLKALSLIRRKDRVHSPLWQWWLSRYYPRYRVLDAVAFFDTLVRRVAGHAPRQPLDFYLAELAACKPLRAAWDTGSIKGPDTRLDNPALAGFYYAFVRETRPGCIVETGTAAGALTSLMVAALAANAHGVVRSIDLPSREGVLTMDSTVAPDQAGFLIPREFREHWEYLPGDAKLLLPRVLVESSPDIFIHDSLHTRTHMSFEYATARALMRPNTVIASDDSLWNASWVDFIHTHRLTSYTSVKNPNVCVTINEFDAYETAQGLDIHK